mmetsp:Transcript_6524/g.15487  ORF Transcript_6524/g.15487 Transcript_6524/m.15487 type:complete len:214 (+) Transcript_6524:1066-1707(+)
MIFDQLLHPALNDLAARSMLGLRNSELLDKRIMALVMFFVLQVVVSQRSLQRRDVLRQLQAHPRCGGLRVARQILAQILAQLSEICVDVVDACTELSHALPVLAFGLLRPCIAVLHALLEIPATAAQGLFLAVQPGAVAVQSLDILLHALNLLPKAFCKLGRLRLHTVLQLISLPLKDLEVKGLLPLKALLRGLGMAFQNLNTLCREIYALPE